MFRVTIAFCGRGYYLTILFSTVCRYVAVFHPFKFNLFFEKWRPRFVVIILALAVIFTVRALVVVAVLQLEATLLTLIDIILITSVVFASIIVLFVVIIVKLMKLNVVAPIFTVEMSRGGLATASQVGSRRKHVVAVKTFAIVTVCFVLGYAASFLAASGLIDDACNYLYFANHVCNPFIYVALNREFRRSFLALFKRS